MQTLVWAVSLGVAAGSVLLAGIYLASRFKRCPRDKIMVVYGSVNNEGKARCVPPGGVVWVAPMIQAYTFLSLDPIAIPINLRGAQTKDGAQVDFDASFSVAIGTEPDLMANAAERLLGLSAEQIKSMVLEVIIGRVRRTLASFDAEGIHTAIVQMKFRESLRGNIKPELEKLGLWLKNINVERVTKVDAPTGAGAKA